MATKASAPVTSAPWAAAPVAEPAAPTPAAAAVAPEAAPAAAVAPEAAPAAPVVAPTPAAPAVPPVAEPAAPVADTAAPAPETTLQKLEAVVTDAEEMVIVTAPKAFMLRVNNDLLVPVKAGVQRMRKSWAEHWYSVANGLKKFEEDV